MQKVILFVCFVFILCNHSVICGDQQNNDGQYHDKEVLSANLARIDLNFNKIQQELTSVQSSKENHLAIMASFEVLKSNSSLVPGVSSSEFTDMLEKTVAQLAQLTHQERELIVRKKILEASIGILRGNVDSIIKLDSVYRAKLGKSDRDESCACFNVKTGKTCSISSVNNEEIVEINFSSSTVKTLNSSYTPKTCKEYLYNYYSGAVGDGLYLIRPSTDIDAFPVYCDMSNGGYIYLNGIGTTRSPLSSVIPPLMTATIDSAPFKLLLMLSTNIKTSLGDTCTINSTSPVPNKDEILSFLCSHGDGKVNAYSTGLSFIKYYMK